MAQQRGRWELTIDARQSSLGAVADFIEEMCDTLDLDEDTAFAVRLATDEACQNAVEHSCHFAEDREVTVSCEQVGSDLAITIRDRGEPFDPTKARPPRFDAPLDERNGGGLGIYFMRQMMDEVRFDRAPDGVNSVTMVKRGVVASRERHPTH